MEHELILLERGNGWQAANPEIRLFDFDAAAIQAHTRGKWRHNAQLARANPISSFRNPGSRYLWTAVVSTLPEARNQAEKQPGILVAKTGSKQATGPFSCGDFAFARLARVADLGT
jgi:hypothetical protein